ncbi:hypothetical protein CPB83DRAFT_865297 [Crepidotus variabilis]|uniref:Uncharacterized protein n=1 Tax=Crepidotus variabilis TaxID=179855 RepID=A0A9P6E3B3_9AGAR|nr:hypothetical protein CPB83DRAFT_865297 [Crepidotus variabilis]
MNQGSVNLQSYISLGQSFFIDFWAMLSQCSSCSVPQNCKLSDGTSCDACILLANTGTKITSHKISHVEQDTHRRDAKSKVNGGHDPLAHRLPVELSRFLPQPNRFFDKASTQHPTTFQHLPFVSNIKTDGVAPDIGLLRFRKH